MGFSNEISSISPEFRNFDGSVELIFHHDENDAMRAFFQKRSDNQISNKISLRRSIQLKEIDEEKHKQIEYFLNGKQIDRFDIKNFLQVFGFAHSCPFKYLMNSDVIATVESSDEKIRLNWLESLCGIDEFFEKRNKSIRILKETEGEIQNVDASLLKIDTQISIFASNETQQIYQHWFKREKELGHFKRLYRIKELQVQIKKQSTDIDKQMISIATNKSAIIQYARQIKDMGSEKKIFEDELDVLRSTEYHLRLASEQCKKEKLALEEPVNALKSLVQQGVEDEDSFVQQKQMYQEMIEKNCSRINVINANIDGFTNEKFTIDQEIDEFESQITQIIMNCQQNQRLGTQFVTILQRNEHLKSFIKRTKNAIGRENRNLNKLKQDLESEKQELQNLNDEFLRYNEQLSHMDADNATHSFYEQQQIFHDLESQQVYVFIKCFSIDLMSECNLLIDLLSLD